MGLRVAGEKKLWSGGLLSADVWVSLHGGVAASSGNELDATDTTGDHYAENYARKKMQSTDWTVSDTTGAAHNTNAIAFAAPGAGNEWAAARSVALWDAATGGNILVDAPIQGAPLVGASADPISFGSGALTMDV